MALGWMFFCNETMLDAVGGEPVNLPPAEETILDEAGTGRDLVDPLDPLTVAETILEAAGSGLANPLAVVMGCRSALAEFSAGLAGFAGQPSSISPGLNSVSNTKAPGK